MGRSGIYICICYILASHYQSKWGCQVGSWFKEYAVQGRGSGKRFITSERMISLGAILSNWGREYR